MINVDTIILGGGWTGSIFALELKRNFPSLNVAVLEKSNTLGGLLKSEVINGHVFDIAGSHIIFSRDKDLLDRMLSLLNGNFMKHIRKTYILLNFIFVPYPLENSLYILPPEDRAEALISFLEAWASKDVNWAPKTFKDWIYGFFGEWIAEKYLIPYNEKVWKRPLDKIDVDWVYIPGRLPIPNWKDVVRSALGIPTIGYVEQSTFYYPKRGGIQALLNSAVRKAKSLNVKFMNNVEVFDIKKSNDKWIINDKFKAKKLISTIPLKELVKILNAPKNVMKASEELDYNKVVVVGLALKKTAPKHHWIYVPDHNVVFHRYAWISNYSPKNSPNGESTILAEISLPPNSKLNLKELVDKVITDLEKLNVLKKDEILFTKAWLHEYGYPVYTVGHREKRQMIMAWLKEQNITSVGRWGSWQYWNIDRIYKEILITLNGL